VIVFVCVFLLRFGITKFVITETLGSGVIFKIIIALLHTGRFVIVHLYSSLSTDPRIFPYGKFTPKITIFGDFGGCKPTVIVFKATTVKLGVMA